MAEYLPRFWPPNFEGQTRQHRQGGAYQAYVPDPLMSWNLVLPGTLASDIADAEAAVRGLSTDDVVPTGLEGLARVLLRAEAVASSRIEGLAVGPRRLLRAEAVLARGGSPGDPRAAEILGNIGGMRAAIDLGASRRDLRREDLLEIHRLIMEQSQRPELGGQLRTTQNWIGGNSYNPLGADFVPPPHENVPLLVDDLIEYLNSDSHSPLTQAGIAHAQFETIHPFADGNGRTGRALLHVVLLRRGLASRLVPPVSLVLANWVDTYIGGLTSYRHTDDPDSPARSEAAHAWLGTLAVATRQACSTADRYGSAIMNLGGRWREQVGRIRKHSSVDLLLAALPGAPVITVEAAGSLINRSTVNTGRAVNRLLEAGVLVQRNVGKQRYRIFESPDVIDLFVELEQSLISGKL